MFATLVVCVNLISNFFFISYFALIAKFVQVVCPKFTCNKIASLHTSHFRDFEIKERSRAELDHESFDSPIVSSANRGARQPCKLSQMALTWGTNLCKCLPDSLKLRLIY